MGRQHRLFHAGEMSDPMYLEDRIQNSWGWHAMLKLQRLLAVISTVIVVFELGIVVVCRYIFEINVLGYDEIILIGAYWMYFIGSSYATWEESHVSADVLSIFVSKRTQTKLKVFSKVVQVLVGVPLVYLSFDLVRWDILIDPRTIDWGIPYLIPHTGIFVGFVMMLFYNSVYLLRDYHRVKDFKG